MSAAAALVEILPDDKAGISHALTKMVSSIGADPDCDIRLAGKGVEPVHAQIRIDGGSFVIEAVGDGRVVVNGRRAERRSLASEDLIDLGSKRLRFAIGVPEVTGRRPPDVKKSAMVTTLRSLVEFSELLMRNYDIETIMESMLDGVIGITQADRGFVLLVEKGEPQVRAARNMERSRLDRHQHALSDSIVRKVLASREPVIVSDALHDREFSQSESVVDFKLCSVLCVPLLARGNLLGAIYLGNDNVVNLFTHESLEVAKIFAGQAALMLRNALLVNDLQFSNANLTQQLVRLQFGDLIGSCDSMLQVFRKVDKIASTDISVLIQGETGTGKELIANEIHRRSNRARGPFIVVNCGAIPENLLESEFFGHMRGAFTGAVATTNGKFQAAAGGTLFLDEVGEMPLNLQVKLLRAIEERSVTRVGDTKSEKVDIRIVAATNRNLQSEVKAGRFREDLYYRLNVVTLGLPPLRERGDDTVLVARYLLQKYANEMQQGSVQFSAEALRAIRLYPWPGNIRELENRIRKAVVFSEGGVVTAGDLDLADIHLDTILELADAKEEFARGYVSRVLRLNAGNRTKTAKDLGVDVRTIFRYLEKGRGDGEGEQGD